MPFVPYGGAVDATLAIVAYGVTTRLRACLDSIVSHESESRFDVVCVLSPTERDADPDPSDVPPGVHVVTPEANLGWAGGLQLARRFATGEWMAWIQDDNVLHAGYLDAHIRAGRALPSAGALAAVSIDDDGRATGVSGGTALPGVFATSWTATAPLKEEPLPDSPLRCDWITSKGMLVRLAAWDDVGGPCARHYPLNRVDKEFSTHLRTHGWELYVVPDARVGHLQSQSAPRAFRLFLLEWQNQPFLDTWDDAIRAMQTSTGPVEHPCHAHADMADVEREVLREASRILVPFAWSAAASINEREEKLKEAADREREVVADATASGDALATRNADLLARNLELVSELEAMRGTFSWRITAPLRTVRARLR